MPDVQGDKRGVMVHVRVSEAERALFKEAAERAKARGVSSWMRDALLRAAQPPPILRHKFFNVLRGGKHVR